MPKKPTLLLFGDAVRDEYILPQHRLGGLDEHRDTQDWQHHDQWIRLDDAGGVEMTARMLNAYDMAGVHLAEADTGDAGPNLTSIAEIEPCEVDDKTRTPTKFVTEQVHFPKAGSPEDNDASKTLYRVTRFLGYSGRAVKSGVFKLPPGYRGPPDAIVMNDAGNVLRHSQDGAENAFVAAMTDVTEDTDLVIKMHLPLMRGLAWTKLCETTTARSRVVVIHADDLREAGMALSRCPSWDQMVSDLMRAKALKNRTLTALTQNCDLLIIQFDVEGAVVIETNGEGRIHLVYDPGRAEGEIAKSIPGQIVGTMNAFLVQFLLDYTRRAPGGDICDTVKRALGAARMFAESGYRREGATLIYPPVAEWVKACDDSAQRRNWPVYHATSMVWSPSPEPVDLLNETLLSGSAGKTQDEVYFEKARLIVKNGCDAEVTGLPHGRFGKLLTVDREEIQSLRAMDTLIQGYIADTSKSQPLSLAVFGPPGSGKSFGVKQLVDKDKTPIREYNLSQAGEADLPGFFHEIRDLNLQGKTPLCFFDEFDSRDCTLLKSFLAPMQDGVFLEGEALRPIGRAIFVFAGGTAPSLSEFAKYALWDKGWKGAKKREKHQRAKAQKLPDFVSRLRGFLNVKGPNAVPLTNGEPFETRSENDPAYVLRRAILLRLFIEDNMDGIINDSTKTASIAPQLLNALLEVHDYKHGARSMELLVQAMARGPSQRKLDRSHLPIDALVDHYVAPAQVFRDRLAKRT